MPNSTLPPSAANCCAIIVTYNADSQFFERLKLICEQFNFVVIIDNGSEPDFQTQLQHYCQKTATTLKLIQNPRNRGIAKALNQGLEYASAQQFSWVITFDQDTLIYPTLFSELIAIYNQAPIKPVLLGSNYFHEAINKSIIIPHDRQKYVERKTLITSGTLMWLKLPEMIGKFREDYFIDSVDHEFSVRARRHGYRLWMSSRVLMRHTIGGSTTFHRHALFKIPEHNALRKYYITRNCLVTVFNYYRHEPLWCIKQLVRLAVEFLTVILYEQSKTQKIFAMGLGIFHALTGKMGELTNHAGITEGHGRQS